MCVNGLYGREMMCFVDCLEAVSCVRLLLARALACLRVCLLVCACVSVWLSRNVVLCCVVLDASNLDVCLWLPQGLRSRLRSRLYKVGRWRLALGSYLFILHWWEFFATHHSSTATMGR